MNPFLKDGWFNLSPFWEWLEHIGKERHEQKLQYNSTRLWHPKSHVPGVCGEFTITLATGKPFDSALKANGQGNTADFGKEDVEVKCATFWSDPHLKHPVRDRKWPKFFMLVALDEKSKRSKIVGWTTKEKLEQANIQDYGYGPQRSMPPKELESGLPPPLQ
jgi:hypothetical protein